EDRHATSQLERLPTPLIGVLPDLSVARDGAHETHSLAPGLARGAGRGRWRARGPGRRTRCLRTTGVGAYPRLRRGSGETNAATRITLRPHDPSTGEGGEKQEGIR